MTTVNIYCLVCPIDYRPRYVGQTTQTLPVRLSRHINENKPTAKGVWIDALKGERLAPLIVLLEVVPVEDGNACEQKWMSLMVASGAPLLNGEVYTGSNYAQLHKDKVNVGQETFLEWKRKYESGDYTVLAGLISGTPAQAKYVIERKRGTLEEVEIITKFYEARRAA